MTEEQAPRWPVVTGVGVGAAFAAFGVFTLITAADDTNPPAAVRWLLALVVLHDLVLVPFVLLVSTAVRRLLPRRLSRRVNGAMLVSGAVGLVAWPLVRGYGRSPGNPSILPRDYGTGLLVTLALIWGTTVLLVLLDRQRRTGAQ